MTISREMNRRQLLKGGLIMLAGLALPGTGFCRSDQNLSGERAISLANIHTGEELRDLTYWADGRYLSDSLERCNWLLRDHRSNDVHKIDPNLFDLVYAISNRLCSSEPVQIISGYRSPATNQLLRATNSGVAKHSLHMAGKALDIRVADCKLDHLRKTAKSLRAGGVGYYPDSQFVHIDTGRVRYW